MNVQGLVRLEFVDSVTGATRTEEHKNFIFNDEFNNIMYTSRVPAGIYISEPNAEVFPLYNRVKNFYTVASYNTTTTQGSSFTRTFYAKTSESPAYIEYYALFNPANSTRNIGAIGLSYYPTNSWEVQTAVNLWPFCRQESTEYLNVYYRVILVEDANDTETNEWTKNTLLNDIAANTSFRTLSPNNPVFYPFRINEDMGPNGKVNFLSLEAKNRVELSDRGSNNRFSTKYNGSLRNVYRNYVYPQPAPNQYQQLVGQYLNTVLRFGSQQRYLYPYRYAKELGQENSGVGNVFATRSSADTPYFDATSFAVGSGRMYANGQWNDQKNAFPSRFVATITKTGKTASEMQYWVHEYHDCPRTALPLLAIGHTTKTEAYSKPERVHYDEGAELKLRAYQENRSFIFWNKTGITIYDILNGTIESYDAESNPPVPVTDVVNVKVDIFGNIWIACANTGLWKLKIDEDTDTKTLTQVGNPAGTSNRVYAIDTDNFGNVFAIYWGLGLHYTTDGGLTWVNAIINYPSFSEYDENGLNSKWRFCTGLKVNPHRNVVNGNAQILLTQASDVNNGSQTAGCWYDQISATATGITTSTVINSLGYFRSNPTKECIQCAKNTDQWFTYGSSSQYLYSFSFQQNTAPRRLAYITGGDSMNAVFWKEGYDVAAGKVKEYITIPSDPLAVDAYTYCIDDQKFIFRNDENQARSDDWFQTGSCCVPIGPNRMVVWAYGRSILNQVEVMPIFTPKKKTQALSATFWGWNGGSWVKNFHGSKDGHTSADELVKGVVIRFADGPTGTTSFAATDQYTFTCFDGYFKDNSSKLWLKDAYYFKPREIIEEFSSDTVQVYDRSYDVGLLNNPNINVDWDISKLPDTVYDGKALVTDGDDNYPYNSYLDYMDGSADKSRYKNGATVTGNPVTGGTYPITWPSGSQSDTTFFNGESGYTLEGSQYVLGSNPFTVETWVYVTGRSPSNMNIVDFRNESSSEIGALQVTPSGQVVWFDGTSENGSGPVLPLNEWVHVALSRKQNNNWELALNGKVASDWTREITFTGPKKLHIGKRFVQNSNWGKHNTLTFKKDTDFFGTQKAHGVVVPSYNNNSVTQSRIPYRAGEYVFSMYVKKGIRPKAYLSLQLGSASLSAVYDFDNDEVTPSNRAGVYGREVLTGGWVRFWVGVTAVGSGSDGVVNFKPAVDNNGNSEHTNGEAGGWFSHAMLNTGTEPKDYVPSGTSDNLIPDDSENFESSYRGFRGALSNIRITKGVNRYNGNFSVPVEPFKDYQNDYSGSRLKFSNVHHQGAIMAKKELVGNWTVQFQDISPTAHVLQRSRPTIFFGVTTTPYVQQQCDIGYRFCPAYNGKGLSFFQWSSAKWDSSAVYEDVRTIRIQKLNHRIFVWYQTAGDPAFKRVNIDITDYAPIHYIAFWQETPAVDDATQPNTAPLVSILENGSAPCVKVGSPRKATGAFHPKFLAVDNYWETDVPISLDGKLLTKRRTCYEGTGAPLSGECYVHQHGAILFHQDDIGKKITGRVVSLHE